MPNISYNPGPNFRKSSGFGDRTIRNKPEWHPGIDFSAELNSSIRAASSGVVVYSGYNGVADGMRAGASYGNTVIIKSTAEDGTKYYTLYAHLNGKNMPKVGDVIKSGGSIGEVGMTGRTNGPHLHFEILNDKTPVAHASGGPIGFKSGEKSYRHDPDNFTNWADPEGAYSATTSSNDLDGQIEETFQPEGSFHYFASSQHEGYSIQDGSDFQRFLQKVSLNNYPDNSSANEYLSTDFLDENFSMHDEDYISYVISSSQPPGIKVIPVYGKDQRIKQILLQQDESDTKTVLKIVSADGALEKVLRREAITDYKIEVNVYSADGILLETHTTATIESNGKIYYLQEKKDIVTHSVTLTVLDEEGNEQKSRTISHIKDKPLADSQAEALYADVADFLTALRQKDTAGMILATARIALDYARSEGMVTAQLDGLVGDVSSGLALVNSLRSIRSGDTLAKIGGTVRDIFAENRCGGLSTSN